MDAIDEFAAYFRSGNDVPVERATIPADLAKRLLNEFSSLKGRLEEYEYAQVS